jgi:tRNA threonylcarbamoyladenosine biosynthesis protein TsaE
MVNYQEVEDEFQIESPRQLDDLAPKIITLARDHKVWLFEGDMGAGKTTTIQALCRAFKVTDQVTSPSYSLMNEYHSATDIFYHFDFYRIQHENEALDIGADEFFDSGKICFIEWPNKVNSILPQRNMVVNISIIESDIRLIKIHWNE